METQTEKETKSEVECYLNCYECAEFKIGKPCPYKSELTAEKMKTLYFAEKTQETHTRYFDIDGNYLLEKNINIEDSDTFYAVERTLFYNGEEYVLIITEAEDFLYKRID